MLTSLKQQHTQSPNFVVGREYRPYTKIYGKNFRVSSRRLKSQGFFFDLVCGPRASRLAKVDVQAGSTLLPEFKVGSLVQRTPSSLYDAGFFFPQAQPIGSNLGLSKGPHKGHEPSRHLSLVGGKV